MKKIDAYKTNDGKLFEDLSSATTHEDDFEVTKKLHDFYKENLSYDFDSDHFVKTMKKHKHEFIDILNLKS